MTDHPRKFDYLGYRLPLGSAEEYANRAISLLSKLSDQSPDSLPHLLASNTVLTLSGVRAFDTYIELGALDRSQVSNLIDQLANIGLTLYSNATEYDPAEDGYSLINHEALRAIPQQYKPELWIQPFSPYNANRLLAWTYIAEHNIHAATENGILPRQWSNHYWIPHDIRFGMLLGYPGEAIASLCWSNIAEESDTPLNVRNAKIAYHDVHDAAQPIYTYAQELSDHPSIVKHQELWSDILTKVYTSEWYKNIGKDPRS